VKHVYCFRELRHVQNPVLAFLVNSDFHYPRPHGSHWLPVGGLQAELNAVQLMAGLSPRGSREEPQSVEARPHPDQSLASHGGKISGLVSPRQGTRVWPNKRMQLAARSFRSASPAGRRPFELRAGLGGFASGRRAVYGRRTAGVS